MTTPTSAVTRINKGLKALGRAERLVRGRGYYYLHGGEASALPSSMICVYWLLPEDYGYGKSEVEALYRAGGIELELPS